jgi:hypothetical protein
MDFPILTPVYRKIRGFGEAVRKSVAIFRVVGYSTAVELDRVGLLERKAPPSRLRMAFRATYILIFLIVLVLPTWKEEPVAYFAALLALGGAWLIAVPQLSRELRSIDLSSVTFGAETWQAFLKGLAREKIDFPTIPPEEERKLAGMVPPLVQTALPLAMLDLIVRLAWRAVALSLVALLGLLVGPRLAEVHWWLGWSPVSILYAVPTPWALALLSSLVIPVIVYTYVSAQQLHKLEPPPDTE